MRVATVESIAARVGGAVRGDPQREIHGAAPLTKAGPHDLTFVVGAKTLRGLTTFSAGACFLSRADEAAAAKLDATFILVDDAQDAFVTILQWFRPQRPRPMMGVSPAAHVSSGARFGRDCNVHPGASIGDDVVLGNRCDVYPGACLREGCRIGDDCVIHPNAVLYPDVVLGNRVIVHAGAVLGADGFGYRFRNGRFERVPQLGWVQVEDDVEIGACTTVDRGTIGPTVIGAGTKLDNLVMIGHNCELGKHNAFASQVGLAGSVTTGDYVRCAGQVGIADHVHLGAGSTYGAKAGVHRDMPPQGTYVGVPAMDEAEAIRMAMTLPKVPELRRQVRKLEQELEALKQQLHDDRAAA